MVAEVSTATRTEVLEAIRSRYREASKRDKSEDARRVRGHWRAVTESTPSDSWGVTRKKLSRAPSKGRRIYDEAVRQALVVVWEASDRICGKRLKAALPSMVESLERHGHLDLDPRRARAAVLGERQYHGPSAQTGEAEGRKPQEAQAEEEDG